MNGLHCITLGKHTVGVVLLMQIGGIFTMATVVKQTRSMCKKLPFLCLMDLKTLHGAKLCIYACGDMKKARTLSNISTS